MLYNIYLTMYQKHIISKENYFRMRFKQLFFILLQMNTFIVWINQSETIFFKFYSTIYGAKKVDFSLKYNDTFCLICIVIYY